MGLKAMTLIVTALIILVLPGILYNNFVVSAIAPPSQPLFCPNDPGDVTCQGTVAVGCQAVPAQCSLQTANPISFLNQASPFTQLVQGNIFGLFSGLTNGPTSVINQAGHGPFDTTGGTGLFYSVNCQGTTSGAIDKSQRNWLIGHCTQTNGDNSNTTEANAITWSNWNPDYSGVTKRLQLFALGNGTFPMTCSWIATINYTLIANNPGWNYFGCDVSQGSRLITHAIWSLLIAMPVTIGGMTAGPSHQYLFAQLEPWDTAGCLAVQSNQFGSNACTNFLNQFKGTPAIFTPAGSETRVSFVPQAVPVILGFLGGVVLFIIGLGLSFTAGTVGAGVNAQGTRLAQSLGLGLLVWSPMYSEFSLWFTSGLMPAGLDGSIGIMSFILTGLFFTGIFWQTLSTSGSDN